MTGRAAEPRHVTSRDRIASAAKREFAEFGFAGARVARIAQRSRLNKQLIFYYFGSKAHLYEAVMSEAGSKLTIAGSPPPARVTAQPSSRRLREVLRSILASLDESPEVVRLLLGDAANSTPAQQLADRTIAQVTSLVCDIVSQGQGLGYFRDDLDPSVMARHTIALVLGHLALESAHGAPSTTPGELSTQIADHLLQTLTW
ncbi:MAG: TetR/AcrR family transcriptional regulator [Gemmatimonadales bacterium]